LKNGQAPDWLLGGLKLESGLMDVDLPKLSDCLERRVLELVDQKNYKEALICAAFHQDITPVISNTSLYNIACLYSLDNQIDNALQHLRCALDAGFDNVSHLVHDPDLEVIRSTEAFRVMIRELVQKKKQVDGDDVMATSSASVTASSSSISSMSSSIPLTTATLVAVAPVLVASSVPTVPEVPSTPVPMNIPLTSAMIAQAQGVKIPTEWTLQVDRLFEMGFKDVTQIVAALKKVKGSVDAAILNLVESPHK